MKKKNPKDYSKLYDFQIKPEKIATMETQVNRLAIKHFRNAFIFGFLIELMIVKTKICNKDMFFISIWF